MVHPLTESADAVVIGSGFGASVAAYRLADAGKNVVVLERGRAYGPGDFARTPSAMARNFWDPSEQLYGLFDAWSFRGLEGLVSSGLGGGSLIYANVLLRKDEKWFVTESPLPGGGYETWPVTYDDLVPHYEAAEQILAPAPYPYDDTPKTMAFESAARRMGLPTMRPPLAVTFARPGEAATPNVELPMPTYGNVHGRRRVTCTRCGECDMGCNTGAKNTLDHNYLSLAAHHGADIRTLHEVRGIRPDDGGGYVVSYVVHDPEATGKTATQCLAPHEIHTRRVIVGAGTFGTTFLLLRNRSSLPGLGPALGTRFSGNGDLLTVLLGCTMEGQPLPIDGGSGTVITSAIRVPDARDGGTGRGYYIEDAGFPGFLTWLVELGQVKASARRGVRFAWEALRNRLLNEDRSNVSASVARLLGDGRLSGNSLPLLGMGRDIPDGRMTLRRNRLAIDWTIATSRPYFSRMRSTMEALGDELGAGFQDNPLWWAGRVVTVHPLGGAPMGRHPVEGICDSYGEVFGHPGLHVVDGAALPGPVGANPALTIAALADRAAAHMLEQPWAVRRAASHRPAVAERETFVEPEAHPVRADATAVSFTERMVGHVFLGEADTQRGAAQGRVTGSELEFVLTITARDIEAFVADPLHPADATGTVTATVLGGRCQVERGWFNLFVRPVGRRGRRMVYRLWLRDAAGAPVTLVGDKAVGDDPGLDLWADTTRLRVRLLAGHIAPPPAADTPPGEIGMEDVPVIAAGELMIRLTDFAKQLTTFRASGPGGAVAVASFARLFLGELWRVYLTPDHPTLQGVR
jgi:cholesterol oxidase